MEVAEIEVHASENTLDTILQMTHELYLPENVYAKAGVPRNTNKTVTYKEPIEVLGLLDSKKMCNFQYNHFITTRMQYKNRAKTI